jgi:hypothetical protein
MSSLLSSFEITDENTTDENPDETINIDVIMVWINNAGRMQEVRRSVCRYETGWPNWNSPKRTNGTQGVTD